MYIQCCFKCNLCVLVVLCCVGSAGEFAIYCVCLCSSMIWYNMHLHEFVQNCISVIGGHFRGEGLGTD